MTAPSTRTPRRRSAAAPIPWAAVTALALGGAAVAQDEGATAEVERPAYGFLRFQEDWSVLKDLPETAPRDLFDPIKYVPLSDDGAIWASFGASSRLRVESWSNFNFDSSEDDTFVLWRALVHADLHLGEHVRGFIQGKSALSGGRNLPGGRRILDEDALDLEQAFLDLTLAFDDGTTLTLRPGRQSFLFGKQRLVSPLPWANTLRRWDGVSAILDWGDWNVHGFWSQFVPVQKFDFNDPDAQTQFYGVYATTPLAAVPLDLDLYFLGLDRDDNVTFNGTTGTEERYTLGGRLSGRVGAFDYDFEGAYQFGEVGPGDVSAFMIGSQAGWQTELWARPRVFAGFDYGSGDDAPGGDVETFNQLFPLGHAYLGYIDAVGRQNVIDFNLGVSLTPLERLTALVAGHFFWRADSDDAFYNAGGGVIRAGGLDSSREVGQEIDVVLRYRFDRHLVGELGYSHFFAGDFIQDSGTADDIDFLYVQLEYTF